MESWRDRRSHHDAGVFGAKNGLKDPRCQVQHGRLARRLRQLPHPQGLPHPLYHNPGCPPSAGSQTQHPITEGMASALLPAKTLWRHCARVRTGLSAITSAGRAGLALAATRRPGSEPAKPPLVDVTQSNDLRGNQTSRQRWERATGRLTLTCTCTFDFDCTCELHLSLTAVEVTPVVRALLLFVLCTIHTGGRKELGCIWKDFSKDPTWERRGPLHVLRVSVPLSLFDCHDCLRLFHLSLSRSFNSLGMLIFLGGIGP